MSDTSRLCTVELLQSWRGGEGPQQHCPLRWAIYVETSPGIGNIYQIIGNSDNYAIDVGRNQPLERTFALEELGEMEGIFETVEIVRNVPSWNNNDWIISALGSLSQSKLSGIMPKARLARNRTCDGIWLWHAQRRLLKELVDNAARKANGNILQTFQQTMLGTPSTLISSPGKLRTSPGLQARKRDEESYRAHERMRGGIVARYCDMKEF
ncbi:uncharacterized protein F5147DRAFT_762725 [Suillus discolor]|uniref:Uncharacterized protein n=1 Tax=Suillus discolor TaxID=1912936 RepID=A0A9P7F0Z7_9AGAM|nr:uncharacterized protein F5147DRAFT_762725 [Suillus discolor]KAG2101339.1 hypothetical protein F5147DRAFT_762725 [Suillus discolor]